MTQPYAFIFDMDGTMIDNMGLHVDIWIDVLAKHNIPMTPERFHREASGKRNPEIFRLFLDAHLTDAQIEQLAEEKEAAYRELYRPHLKPVTGLIPFLEEAQRHNIQLAVATSAYLPNVDFVLDGLRIRHFFEAIVTAEDVVNSKPAPDCFLLAAQKLGRQPAECVVFEDSVTGIEAAKRAGMATAVITTTLSPTELPDSANIICHTPTFEEVEIDILTPLRRNNAQ